MCLCPKIICDTINAIVEIILFINIELQRSNIMVSLFKISKRFCALALIIIMSLSVVSCGNKEQEKELVFSEGVSVEGIDVSGLTMDEALTKVKDEFNGALGIDIIYEENTWTVSFEDILGEADFTTALNKAFEIGHTGDTEEEKAAEAQQAKENPVDIAVTYKCDSVLLREQLTKISDEFNAEREDKIGFDIDKTAEKVVNALSNGELEPVEFELTEEEKAEQEKTLIGTYSTSYSNDDANRNENLRVACEKINGTVLQPGDIFDMNEALGPQTYENGYRAAGVIENGKIVSALGGGVCQVTTTIYNAAILAELEIVERYNHSLMVGYVPIGLDAAVAGTYKNLRFKNDTDHPVYIETYLENNKVVCNIYGYEIHDPGRRVEFESVWVSTIGKPAAKVTEDPNMYEDERVVTYNGKTGAKIDTYKLVYEGDQLVSKEWFSSSTYVATADEVTVGTKPRETVVEDVPVIGEVPTETPSTGTTAPETNTQQPSQPTVEQPAVTETPSNNTGSAADSGTGSNNNVNQNNSAGNGDIVVGADNNTNGAADVVIGG